MTKNKKAYIKPREASQAIDQFPKRFLRDIHETIHSESTQYDLERTDQELNRRIDEANQKVTELVKKTETKMRLIEKDTQNELKDVKRQIDESKSRVVETLALFAALFTFLSLQVQVFKDEKDPDKILALILITGGLITFFVLILDIMVKTKDDAKNFLKTRFFLLLAISILLIVAGVLVYKSIIP